MMAVDVMSFSPPVSCRSCSRSWATRQKPGSWPNKRSTTAIPLIRPVSCFRRKLVGFVGAPQPLLEGATPWQVSSEFSCPVQSSGHAAGHEISLSVRWGWGEFLAGESCSGVVEQRGGRGGKGGDGEIGEAERVRNGASFPPTFPESLPLSTLPTSPILAECAR